MPDFVRITNNDSVPFVYHDNNVKKRIPPGRDMMMQWSLACTLFGDPFLQDEPKKLDRTAALKRSRGNFNYELGMETFEHFMDRLPNLDIFDMETGQQMFMLLWDPDGERVVEYISPDVESNDTVTLLTQQIALLTQQVQALASQRAQSSPELVGQMAVVSTDGPTTAEPAVEVKVTEWVNGDPFAQRAEDAATAPLFDFAALSAASIDPMADGAPVDPANAIPEDAPTDAGVGSGRGRSKLAPK